MTRNIAIAINGVFNGIYEWGKGFKDDETRRKWDWFWRFGLKDHYVSFWRWAEGDDYGRCGHLSCIGGSIYMHPMDFNTVLVSTSGCKCISWGNDDKQYQAAFRSQLRELQEICEDCAKFCGGSFNLYTSGEFYVDCPETIGEFNDETYLEEKCMLAE